MIPFFFQTFFYYQEEKKKRRKREGKKKKNNINLLGVLELVIDSLLGDLREVSGLELSADADKGSLHGLLGGGVEHLGLDLGGLGSPEDEDELVALTGVVKGEVVVVDGIAAVVLGEVSDEVVPGGGGLLGLLEDHTGVVGGDSEDDVLEALAKLELVEDFSDLVVECNAGNCHFG